jgi:hypothetical protein
MLNYAILIPAIATGGGWLGGKPVHGHGRGR